MKRRSEVVMIRIADTEPTSIFAFTGRPLDKEAALQATPNRHFDPAVEDPQGRDPQGVGRLYLTETEERTVSGHAAAIVSLDRRSCLGRAEGAAWGGGRRSQPPAVPFAG